MQYSTIFTVLAAAMTAAAMPSAPVDARTADTFICPATSSQVCCNGVADCLVNVLAKNCENQAYCCESSPVQVSTPSNRLSYPLHTTTGPSRNPPVTSRILTQHAPY